MRTTVLEGSFRGQRAASWDCSPSKSSRAAAASGAGRGDGTRPRLGLPVAVRRREGGGGGTPYLFRFSGHRRRRGHRLHGSGRHDCDAQGCQSASVSKTNTASKTRLALHGPQDEVARWRRPSQARVTYFRSRPLFRSDALPVPPLQRSRGRRRCHGSGLGAKLGIAEGPGSCRLAGLGGCWGSSMSRPHTEAEAATPETGEMFSITLRLLSRSPVALGAALLHKELYSLPATSLSKVPPLPTMASHLKSLPPFTPAASKSHLPTPLAPSLVSGSPPEPPPFGTPRL